MDVSISKAKLLETLKANREIHIKFVAEAKSNYRFKVAQKLEELLEQVKSGQGFNLDSIASIVEPKSYERSYDDAIRMVEFDNRDNITLSQTEFTSYVLDRWNWAGQFTLSNSQYTSGVTSAQMANKYLA